MLQITQAMRIDLRVPVTFDYCKSNDPEDYYRKPNPGMVNSYIDSKAVSRRYCLMIGDESGLPGQFSDSDLHCAENAHIKYQDVDAFVRKYSPQ